MALKVCLKEGHESGMSLSQNLDSLDLVSVDFLAVRVDVVHFVPGVQEYNVYQTSLPFAICRLLSPRTRKGAVDLRRLPCCSCPLVPGVWTRHSIAGFFRGYFMLE